MIGEKATLNTSLGLSRRVETSHGQVSEPKNARPSTLEYANAETASTSQIAMLANVKICDGPSPGKLRLEEAGLRLPRALRRLALAPAEGHAHRAQRLAPRAAVGWSARATASQRTQLTKPSKRA